MLGKKIKQLRIKNNLTMIELSKLCKVSQSYISDLENGKIKNPSIIKIEKIATALEVAVSELLKLPSGKDFAIIENKNNEEINLLYNLLKIRYGEENMNINDTLDDEFIELNIGDKTIVYTKQEFEKFIDHVSTLFPTFKMILDSSKTK